MEVESRGTGRVNSKSGRSYGSKSSSNRFRVKISPVNRVKKIFGKKRHTHGLQEKMSDPGKRNTHNTSI